MWRLRMRFPSFSSFLTINWPLGIVTEKKTTSTTPLNNDFVFVLLAQRYAPPPPKKQTISYESVPFNVYS